MEKDIILEVKGLKTFFYTEQGIVKAVDDVSFSIERGQTVGIVGESGCGKSVTSLSILRLVNWPPGKIAGGEIIYNNRNLLSLKENEMREIRGNDISMIFQEPMTSLNPVFTIGSQIMEAIVLHQKVSRKEARDRAVELLRLVSIPDPDKRIDEYPHNLSGGMRQRVMIAMALSTNPSILIADEPTTALDVTIQAQILDLIKEVQTKYNLTIILITHDLSIIAETADKVIVMYAGKIIEESDVKSIFRNPAHPYTKGLLSSIPRIDDESVRGSLFTIKGLVPDPLDLPPGCYFEPRCISKKPECRQRMPEFTNIENNHRVRCLLYEQ